MTVDQHERSGVLVVRVWVEPAADVPLRARITAERDLERSQRVSFGAAGVPEIVGIVTNWIQDFARTYGQ